MGHEFTSATPPRRDPETSGSGAGIALPAASAERWPAKWTSAPPPERPPLRAPDVADAADEAAAAPRLLPATLTCPQCGSTLPTFVERFGVVEFYCVDCGDYREARARRG